jgi:hypothetical protein
MTWIAQIVGTLAVLVSATFYPAWAATGSAPLALFLAPLATAVSASAALMLSIVTHTPSGPWLLLVLAAANLWAFARQRRRLVTPDASLARQRWRIAVVAVAAAIPVPALRGTNILWDGRFLWLLHARWVYGGIYRDVLGSGQFLPSHPDYPPLIPATVGSLWQLPFSRLWGLDPGVDMRSGLIAITVLNISAVALLGLGFLQLVPDRLSVAGALIGAGVCLAAYGISGEYATDGYADLLGAASAAVALLFLLVLPRGRAHLAVGLSALTAAGLTKNDALPVTLCILALGAVRYRRAARDLPRLMIGTGATLLAWPLLARLLGARSDLLERGHLVGLLTGDHGVWARLIPTLHAIRPLCLPLAVAAACCTGAGLLAMRTARRSLGMGSSRWTWATIAATTASIVGAYLISPHDVAWHLGTSVDRTTIVLRLMLVTEIAGWTVAALNRLSAALPATAPAPGVDGHKPDVQEPQAERRHTRIGDYRVSP